MSQRLPLCGRNELGPGQMLRVDVSGQPPLALLTDGSLEADVGECPLHRGIYNVRTGAALELSCSRALETSPVTAVDEELYIDLE